MHPVNQPYFCAIRVDEHSTSKQRLQRCPKAKTPRNHQRRRSSHPRMFQVSVASKTFFYASAMTLTVLSSDARFDVLGAPNSLLSVALSASQNLYTRRGTLVAVSGKPENVGPSCPMAVSWRC